MGRRTRSLLFALVSVALLMIPGQGLAAGKSSNGPKAQAGEITHGPLVTPHSFNGSLKNLPKGGNGKTQKKPEFELDFGANKAGGAGTASVPRPSVQMPAATLSL